MSEFDSVIELYTEDGYRIKKLGDKPSPREKPQKNVDAELTGNQIVDVKFSGNSVGDKLGRGMTIGGQDLNSLANYFGKGASKYDVDSITFERVHINKVNKFIEQRQANFLKNSSFPKAQAIRYFSDALRATIINVRNLSRQKIGAITPSQSRTQAQEVLPQKLEFKEGSPNEGRKLRKDPNNGWRFFK